MFIKLTHKDTGKTLYVNPKKILAFDESTEGTRIVFSENHAYVVVETMTKIKSKALAVVPSVVAAQ